MDFLTVSDFGNQKLSIIKDPFNKTQITTIFVHASSWYNKWTFTGTVKFTNGNTSGEQSFTGSSFDDVVLQIKAMIDNM